MCKVISALESSSSSFIFSLSPPPLFVPPSPQLAALLALSTRQKGSLTLPLHPLLLTLFNDPLQFTLFFPLRNSSPDPSSSSPHLRFLFSCLPAKKPPAYQLENYHSIHPLSYPRPQSQVHQKPGCSSQRNVLCSEPLLLSSRQPPSLPRKTTIICSLSEPTLSTCPISVS